MLELNIVGISIGIKHHLVDAFHSISEWSYNELRFLTMVRFPQLFRRVAAALPGMESNPNKSTVDSILLTDYHAYTKFFLIALWFSKPDVFVSSSLGGIMVIGRAS